MKLTTSTAAVAVVKTATLIPPDHTLFIASLLT